MQVNAMLLSLALVAFVAPDLGGGPHVHPPTPNSPPGFVPDFVPDFVASLAGWFPPDRCAELDEYGNPSHCKAVGPEMAPWWDEDVCCDAAGCTELDRGHCTGGAQRYWCESAILYEDGSLDCVYEVPSYCEVYACSGPTDLTAPPLEHAICCFSSGCYDHEGGPCGGFEIWCGYGITNEDGTVTCQDGAY
jgi:hypothetical protein